MTVYGKLAVYGKSVRLGTITLVLLAGAFIALGSGTVVAQEPQYKFMDKHPKAILEGRAVREAYNAKKAAVNSPGPLTAQQQAAIKNYYSFHIAIGMASRAALNSPNQFYRWRFDILRDLTDDEVTGTASKHQWLVNEVLDLCKICLRPDFSPACRVNAAILMGELNEREMGGSGSSLTPPVPLPAARNELLKLVSNAKEDPAVQVAALVGLVRHAKALAAAGNVDNQLIKAFVQIAEEQAPANAEAAETLRWKQRLAIEALGAIRNPAAIPLVERFVADESLPMWLRCTAADALGKMDFRNASDLKLDYPQLAKALGSIAVKAVKEQLEGLQSHIRDNPDTGFQPRVGFGEGGVEQEQPENWYVTQVRRELAFHLSCVSSGLQGLQKSNPDAAGQTALSQVLAATREVMKPLETGKQTPQDLSTQILQPAVRLESAVQNL